MSVVFNSVSKFVLAVGSVHEAKTQNALDTAELIYTGPTATVDQYIPDTGTKHPKYALMFASGTRVTDKDALVSEMRVNYVGRLPASKISKGVPVITTSWHEGSSSWTTYGGSYQVAITPGQFFSYGGQGLGVGLWGTGITAVTGGATVYVNGTFTQYYYSISFTSTYTTKAVSFKYLTPNKAAAYNTTQYAGLASEYLGVLNQQTYSTGSSSSTSIAGMVTASLQFTNDLVNHQVTDLTNGWYEVTEVYQTKGKIISSVISIA